MQLPLRTTQNGVGGHFGLPKACNDKFFGLQRTRQIGVSDYRVVRGGKREGVALD
jgi:hypothetical protein